MADFLKAGEAHNLNTGFSCFYAPLLDYEKYQEFKNAVRVIERTKKVIQTVKRDDINEEEDVETTVKIKKYIVGVEKPFFEKTEEEVKGLLIVHPNKSPEYPYANRFFPIEKDVFNENYHVDKEVQTAPAKAKATPAPKPKK